jgi:hypothetical protein
VYAKSGRSALSPSLVEDDLLIAQQENCCRQHQSEYGAPLPKSDVSQGSSATVMRMEWKYANFVSESLRHIFRFGSEGCLCPDGWCRLPEVPRATSEHPGCQHQIGHGVGCNGLSKPTGPLDQQSVGRSRYRAGDPELAVH